MSEVCGIVVGHADLAGGLVRAVESISGVEGALEAVSNDECTPEELERRILSAAGTDPAIVFVDMASGSCAFAGIRAARRLEGARLPVVTGVSLPMLLDFVFHRKMDPVELAHRAVEKGHSAAVVHVPAAPSADVDSTVSN